MDTFVYFYPYHKKKIFDFFGYLIESNYFCKMQITINRYITQE